MYGDNQGASGGRAGCGAGLMQQERRQEALEVGTGMELVQQAGQTVRFGAKLETDQRGAGRGVVAFVEDQIDRVEDCIGPVGPISRSYLVKASLNSWMRVVRTFWARL